MNVEQIIEGLEVSFMLSPAKVTVLRNFGKIPFIEEALSRGTEIEIPRWLALILEKWKVVELSPDERPRLDSIAKAKILERNMERRGLRALAKLHPFFYIMTRLMIRELEDKARKELNISILKEIDTIRSSLYDVLKLRLGKIMDAALMGAISTELVDSMTFEEKVLFMKLSSMIRSWHRVLGIEE